MMEDAKGDTLKNRPKIYVNHGTEKKYCHFLLRHLSAELLLYVMISLWSSWRFISETKINAQKK